MQHSHFFSYQIKNLRTREESGGKRWAHLTRRFFSSKYAVTPKERVVANLARLASIFSTIRRVLKVTSPASSLEDSLSGRWSDNFSYTLSQAACSQYSVMWETLPQWWAIVYRQMSILIDRRVNFSASNMVIMKASKIRFLNPSSIKADPTATIRWKFTMNAARRATRTSRNLSGTTVPEA